MRPLRKLIPVLLTAAALPAAAQTADFLPSDPEQLQILGQSDPSVRKATAIVNGDVVTDTDVDHRLNLVVAANGGRIDEAERQRLRLQILRNLIDEKLQVQEAKNNDITITDADVESTFARVARNFKQTPEQFAEYLRSQGTSATSLKQQIAAELHWSRLLRRRVEPFVNVGDDEVQQVIARLEASKGKDEYRVGEIFISSTPESQGQALATAQNIVSQVRSGASFVAYARQFSESGSAAVGGDLGWLRAEQLPERVRPVLANLSPGQISDPVPVPGGVTVVALIDHRQVLSADPSNAVLNLKQISVDFDNGLTEAQAQEAVRALQTATASMGGCGRAEEVAAKVGGEATSNDQVRMADLPPQLQAVMRDLPIGGVTPPFGSREEGIRVLVLCGRDDASSPKMPSFDEVYAQMNEQRVGMMARRYLRDLRRDAIVDYR